MVRTREVGTLWIGGELSWMEQVCLKSFVDKGQKITLFQYENIPNVPEGVLCRDGREVLDTDDFIKYEKKNSYALFADLFRLHMIRRFPGMIWIDTDVYCHRPMTYDSDYVMGFELPGERRVNNAVLGLPADSDMLCQMLDFTGDRFAIAPFLPPKVRRGYEEARDAGQPVHVSQQPWGVWGPLMVTHYTHALGLADKVQPMDAFYPVPFPDRRLFMRRAGMVDDVLTENTTALHVWASNKRQLGNFHNGLPPKGSFFDRIVTQHHIVPGSAPIGSRGKTSFDGGLIYELDQDAVETFADLTGAAPGFALAAHNRFDCAIQVFSLDPKGNFTENPPEWIDGYVGFLTENGVEPERIRIIRTQKEVRPVDVLCNLSGYGDRFKVSGVKPFLESCLHSDTRLFMDIRKGSGGFPLLRGYGTNRQISTRVEDGKDVLRVIMTPNPPKADESEGDWAEIAPRLAGPEGFFRAGPEGHSFLYMPRSKDTLVVTFDNLDIAMNKRDDRRPWGFSLIKEQGWSMLGVLAGGWTWYRNPWVAEQFDELRDSGFFREFGRVVFYGASMGGYAACAFCPASPGAEVVAISPQSTVDKSVVPWETRYRVVWDRDFSGPYGDAAQVSVAARRVSILYDPYSELDAAHARRFTNPNVAHLRTPLMGHRLGSSLNQMGVLSTIILKALSGDLTSQEFYRILRARKDFPRYQRELFNRALEKGHTDLARRLGAYILARNSNRAVRLKLAQIEADATASVR
ncbi:hypothetical protein C8N32_10968 [Rhodovulum imhoffii]|uniref:Uncharacterized protein n=1 Tax=Rhodovulum imhoffii TaxID=365340 RepID=A0A2T5BRU9_9RHOB|nr:hypothetical protein [Rhodovulum imhoffii]MBK5934059.1 hypothetical protein [Rhodovulum imhoffii]PTN01944.1 hypothetical protein C8N32_10968 [Rhodovulum imhoffii]